MLNSKHQVPNSKQIINSKIKKGFRFGFKSIIIFALLCFEFVILDFGFPSPAHAQEVVSLVVSPPSVDLTGDPGETLQQIVKITNNDPENEVILKVFTADFIVQDDLGTPIKVSESASGRYLASPWFTLESSEIVIPPKTTSQQVVLINIPKDALPGGHYAGIFFEPVPSRGLKKNVSYTSSQIGSLFGITIAGDIKYDALIKDFSVKSYVSEFGPIDFSGVIENQSDTHIRPNSKIVIHDMIGRQLVELPLNEVNIFPFTSRTLLGTWDTVWGLGRYTATLSASYGPGLVAERTLYFWIMPYRLIMAIVVVLLVLLVLFIVIRRHLKSREDHRDDEIDELKRKIIEMENRHN